MIMTTSFPGYDIKISEATARPKVRKPYTPGGRESACDERAFTEAPEVFRGELTRQSVDE